MITFKRVWQIEEANFTQLRAALDKNALQSVCYNVFLLTIMACFYRKCI